MNLKELGKMLKDERLRQGLEISEVMERTKISRMNLEAIEEGNENALPHPVYAKGFVKNYAKFLGMDADKMGNALARIYIAEDDLDYDDLALADTEKLPPVNHGLPRVVSYLIVLLLLVFIGAGAAWFFQDNLRSVFQSEAPDTPPAFAPSEEQFPSEGPMSDMDSRDDAFSPEAGFEPAPLASPFPSLTEETGREALEDETLPELHSEVANGLENSSPMPEGNPSPAVQAEAPQSAPAAPREPEPVQSPEPEQSAEPASPAAPQQAVMAPAGVEKTLEIRAHENCWLSAQADANRPREAFLRPGERFVIAFANNLELRLGNAGGVSLYLDGKPWPLSARSGEVMVVRFP
ncbi:cytoskeleton protein RodZ [Desulfonatronum thiosulfatophilum]|uniref:Cytoskeleton protein RodZ n=1 Tax=Desulfonatronum thiosulfatophilum TaxID=617002 RepID=A0A1G6DRJ5_9BACT|nr:helix-turn-helix domain-containing protein [Desulfonatronum thiosulfatophilum]SDB47813.1 cytoskeleton protein RodZ [Desulfonatronum thiosulfatophilum]